MVAHGRNLASKSYRNSHGVSTMNNSSKYSSGRNTNMTSTYHHKAANQSIQSNSNMVHFASSHKGRRVQSYRKGKSKEKNNFVKMMS